MEGGQNKKQIGEIIVSTEWGFLQKHRGEVISRHMSTLVRVFEQNKSASNFLNMRALNWVGMGIYVIYGKDLGKDMNIIRTHYLKLPKK